MWRQTGNMLFCKHLDIEVGFEMPAAIRLADIHPDLLKLCEWLMYSPWDNDILKDYPFSRKPAGDHIGLAFSGGMDSTAALTLLDNLPHVHCFFMERDVLTDSLMKLDNPLYSIQMVEAIRHERVVRIKTDFESIRIKKSGLMRGFSTDLCVLVGAILCADLCKLSYLSCGMMLESTYLAHGYHYREFNVSPYWIRNTAIFEKAGLKLFFPVAPCSEIVTSLIAEGGRFRGVGISCIRSPIGGKGCGTCYKCFRKHLIAGNLIPISAETQKKLSEEKIKQGASLIHAYNRQRGIVPQLEKYRICDYSFLEGYYEPALEIIPAEHRVYLKNELEKYVKPMRYDLSHFKWGQPC